ncbi:guanylate cyclase [Thiosulfatimonas sediminis]|uniref:Guanylate cyclase n=1 Tax=Thiosulfatimonas sediminis TaxID=2675054 RepID=A0A6F8PTW5_9GAMM|nr:heme NO-binding domain-containing protein [Thiosulfatimonas sediminis]BBP45420.1 guanylate cyclase [Thiosulfatimonas sediminis]
MKGIVFSEFIELVEDKFGLEMADNIIEESNLPSQGAYTQVGTYDHTELITLVGKLSEHSGIAVEDLVTLFGEHLLQRFLALYPQFFENVNNCFDFLDTIENKVHIEVKKLYPEAELPSFDSQQSGQSMQLIYRSNRPFSALAYGLIRGSASYFKENIDIEMEDRSSDHKSFVVFTLTKKEDHA